MQKNNKKPACAGRVHLIGICGTGMSVLAVLLKEQGWEITGSDSNFYEPVSGYLKRHKIDILSPYKKENIPEKVDLIIVGRHSKLNPKENEEVALAFNQKDKVKSFPEILGEITKDRENIVIAGSYGKSTCSALMAYCLLKNKKDIGYFFGAVPVNFDENTQIGKEKYFILEGDEYPAFNGVSKFLYLHPTNVLLTSVEHDHVNIFSTEESYIKPYEELLKLLPQDGLLVAGINNKNVKKVIENCQARIITYGMDKNALYYGANIKYGVETSFVLYKGDKKITELSTSLLGTHNIENIIGVSAFLLEKNMITVNELKNAVSSFGGLKRRLDLKTDKSSVLIYEGFGSSYKKAQTVFDAIKLHFPNKKIITVFEPHTFSWRNKNNLNWYNDIFKDSDETIIFKPPEHGKDIHEQASLEEILKQVKQSKNNAHGVENKKETIKILEKIVKSDDIIILMSSGELGGLIEEIPIWAEQKFPK